MLLNNRQMDDAAGADGSPSPVPDLAKDALYFRYHLVEFITEHLIDLSQAFDGDLQQVLVLAIIGQVHVGQLLKPDNNHGDAAQSISASRIADITCIPRQTVRRKLETFSRSEAGSSRMTSGVGTSSSERVSQPRNPIWRIWTRAAFCEVFGWRQPTKRKKRRAQARSADQNELRNAAASRSAR